MSELIFTEGWLCLGSYDISGTSKGFPFKVSQDIKEWICFPPDTAGPGTSLTRKRAPSTPSAEVPVDGYLDFAGNFLATQAAIGAQGNAVTFGVLRSEGSPVELMPAIMGDYSFGGPVGDVCPFATNLQSSGLLAAGLLFKFGSVSATGNGTSQALGAVAANQTLVIHLHCIGAPGGTSPTLDAIFQRSALGDYTDAATVATFTQLTAAGNQRIEVPGPITDTNFRFVFTKGGTGGSFPIRAAAGISA